jgi:hypothetical protein
MENKIFSCLFFTLVLLFSCTTNETTNETCFKPIKGLITGISGTSGLTFLSLKDEIFRYKFVLGDTTCCTYFRDVATAGDSIIRKGNYLELHHKNTISNWYISSCDDIPYTTDSINYAYAEGIVYKITNEINTDYHYQYIVNYKKYKDYNSRIDNAEIGDTFIVAYNKENPELNRIFNRKVVRK